MSDWFVCGGRILGGNLWLAGEVVEEVADEEYDRREYEQRDGQVPHEGLYGRWSLVCVWLSVFFQTGSVGWILLRVASSGFNI